MPPIALLHFPSRLLNPRLRRARQRLMLLLILTTLLLLSPIYLVYKPPVVLISYLSHLNPSVIFTVPTNHPYIALTIDDAPSQHTLQILELLDESSMSATFFVIGSQVPGHEDVLAEIVRRGHELGNHAMHDEPSRSLPPEVLKSQILEVDALIDAAYDDAGAVRKGPKLFRPGSGFFNQRLLDTVEGMGYRVALGSIYPHDPQISAWRLNAWHVLGGLRKGGVIICHDRRSWTVNMLARVLPEMKKRGWTGMPLGRLLEESKGEADDG